MLFSYKNELRFCIVVGRDRRLISHGVSKYTIVVERTLRYGRNENHETIWP